MIVAVIEERNAVSGRVFDCSLRIAPEYVVLVGCVPIHANVALVLIGVAVRRIYSVIDQQTIDRLRIKSTAYNSSCLRAQ